MLRSLLEHPPREYAKDSSASSEPLAAQHSFSLTKSNRVYGAVDASKGFYVCTAQEGSRSRMNATYRIADSRGGVELEKLFVKQAAEKGIMGVNGHRSVGGIRASLYNAVTMAQVEQLVSFMEEFAKANDKSA